jgi:hypothetical protein
VSVAWNHGAGVNRYFADESLPERETAALKAFARRDPKTWVALALNAAVVGAVLLWFYFRSPQWQSDQDRGDAATVAFLVFALFSAASYLWWELSLSSRVRKAVARQSQVGALLTSSFGPRTLRVTTPDISYELPYTSIDEVFRFGDVLVIKPKNHLVMALPMELVTAADLALIASKVPDRRVREASYS